MLVFSTTLIFGSSMNLVRSFLLGDAKEECHEKTKKKFATFDELLEDADQTAANRGSTDIHGKKIEAEDYRKTKHEVFEHPNLHAAHEAHEAHEKHDAHSKETEETFGHDYQSTLLGDRHDEPKKRCCSDNWKKFSEGYLRPFLMYKHH